MHDTFVVYPYGFVFSDYNAPRIPEHYNVMDILGSFKYYYDRSLQPNVCFINDYFLIIHGHFAHVGEFESLDSQTLMKFLLELYIDNEEEFLNTLDFIGGRYAVVLGNKTEVRIYPDAAGCRSIYYSTDENIISSHAHLLAENSQVNVDTTVSLVPDLKYSLNLSPFNNVKSVIPNLYLDFFSKSAKRFFPRSVNKFSKMEVKERLKLVERLWKEQLNIYSQKYSNVILSLTAGHDSRVSLALAKECKDKISFFTYSPIVDKDNSKSSFERTLTLDRHIVEEILKDIPLNHQFLLFERGKYIPTAEEKRVFDKNSLISHGRYLLKFYKEAFPYDDLIHVRGNLLEIGRAYSQSENKLSNMESIKEVFFRRLKFNKDKISLRSIENVYDERVQDFHYDEVYGYHLLDLFYWENRHGRWFSEVLNETDSAFDTFLPFNMRAILDISLSFDIEQRKSGFMFNEIINRNYPILNFYGKNDERNLYEKNKETKQISMNYFNDINLVGSLEKDNSSLRVKDNNVYLPLNYLHNKYYSEAIISFKSDYGFANLTILSNYSSANQGYLKYELIVNNDILLYEDIAHWRFSNNIRFFNLKKDDVIKIRVTCLRDCQSQSWEKASILKVISYDEVVCNKEYPIKLTSSSPFSIIAV